jgi:hypothetical protein
VPSSHSVGKLEGLTAELDRLSGLWGAQTPLCLWLGENDITTLFFRRRECASVCGGDAAGCFLQRYDIVLVYVDDVSATTSLEYAAQMERYNAEENDF